MQVVVVGGGLVGLAFAIALRTAHPSADVQILEARQAPTGAPDPLDSRATAINLASRDILEHWGVWSSVRDCACAIEQIHVSNRARFGSALMSADSLGEQALGYVVENHHLGAALLARAEALQITLDAPVSVVGVDSVAGVPQVSLADGRVLSADLMVVADGADSPLCQQLGIEPLRRNMDQRAVAANVQFDGAQQGTAFERFTPTGPLALLPLPSTAHGQQRFNLIWSLSPGESRELEAAPAPAFLAALQQAVGWRLGQLTAVGRRTGWDLYRSSVREQVRPGWVIVGNAAHTLHPVAGQGFNLSLRDAQRLAQSTQAALRTGEAVGSVQSLQRYERLVQGDQRLTTRATDTLATLFTPRGLLLDLPRDAALASLDLLPGLRDGIARRGTGRGTGPLFTEVAG